jgi:aromatic ring-opening dioxygenase LigB subunit
MMKQSISVFLLTTIYVLLTIQQINAELAGAILLPHGDFAYDPTLFPLNTTERDVSNKIALAARRVGRWLVQVEKPDIILLSTPHGIKLDNDFGIYMSEKGHGYATIGGDIHNNSTSNKLYNVSLGIDMDLDLSQNLLSLLHNENVSGIYSYNEEIPMPLNWGEIIPLLLLPKEHRTYKHIIWSHPQRRYDHSPDMVSELLRVGQTVANWAQGRPERIAVIISGDLSHTHQQQGPYGYSNTSAPFDDAIGKWAASPYEHTDALLQNAKQLQPHALSCGFTGYVLWHGMMMSSVTKQMSAKVIANLNVTYYGMIAASFAPNITAKATQR